MMGISRLNWQEVSLGTECVIERGISWKREQETTASDTAWPVLTIPNIKEQLNISDVTYINGVSQKVAGRASATVGYTILIGSNGNKERVGDCCYIGKPIHALYASFLMGITPKPHSKFEPRFLYYLMKSPIFRNRIHSSLIGTTSLSNLRLSFLREQIFRVPPLPTQRKIAAILSAYDDLIENNLRRIKILEAMAQNLYRDWFIKFRFPGYQHARFTDSSLNPIPEGWEAVRFSDLLASGLGGDWGLDEPDAKENAPVFVIRGTDFNNIVNGTSLRTPRRFITPSSLAKRQLVAGDLLVENSINAKSRCVGTTLLITDGVLRRLSDPAIAASFCKVYRFKDPLLAPLAHLHMRHLYGEGRMAFYQNVATNGIGNFQSQRFLESEHLVFPANSQRQKEMLGFLNDLTSSTLADQTFILRRTRDLLLPRLISGEVDVSELDITVPEEVAA